MSIGVERESDFVEKHEYMEKPEQRQTDHSVVKDCSCTHESYNREYPCDIIIAVVTGLQNLIIIIYFCIHALLYRSIIIVSRPETMQSAVGFSILSTTVVELQSRVGDAASVNRMTNAAKNISTLG